MFEYITDTDLSIDGQVLDRIIETTKNDGLGDLEVINEIYSIITEAYERGLI